MALVITDGKQTRDRGVYTPLTQAAQGIKQKGVTVYALGVGKGVERSDLQAIASSEETVFTAATFAALGDIVENIRERLCEGTVVAVAVVLIKSSKRKDACVYLSEPR